MSLKLLAVLLVSFSCNAQSLEIKESSNGLPYLSFDNAPAFGYGASPQHILTYLPAGNGNDYKKWVEWAHAYQMNHVRSYPPSSTVKSPSLNLFQRAEGNKFNLNKFNQPYFDELRRACLLMKEKGFFVHLQLWQSVAWKKQWIHNYYNPDNNVNHDISQHAGPGEFMVVTNPLLLTHQKEYVTKILDTTADLGNVYFDIANEIGNGTGKSHEWILEILSTIRQWEKVNDRRVLVTINDEGGVRVKNIADIFDKTDLIIKDLGRWDEHVDAQRDYKKPTASVRNIDWDYTKKQRQYFFSDNNLEVNTDSDLQIRGRKYWWRMYMAKVQMAGAYADSYDEVRTYPGAQLVNNILKVFGFDDGLPRIMKPSYNLNTLSEDNFVYFRDFIQNTHDFPSLQAYDDVVKNHPAAHNYCLQSSNEALIYLESPNGNSGYSYPETRATLTQLLLGDGNHAGYYYHPASGKKIEFQAVISNNTTQLNIPSFDDDLAIYIH